MVDLEVKVSLLELDATQELFRELRDRIVELEAQPRLRWRKGRPGGHGYYLVCWKSPGPGNHRKHISELWFAPGTGWWTSRGYLPGPEPQKAGDRFTDVVLAWARKPEPPDVEMLP